VSEEPFRLGAMPFNVPSRQQIEEQAAKGGVHSYVMARVADTNLADGSAGLRARRRRVPCEVCREICWYDPKSVEQFSLMTLEWICTHCMVKRMRLQRALMWRAQEGGSAS
jgi:hypothetical protein